MSEEIIVSQEDEGERLDVFLARLLAEKYSRSKLKKMIEDGLVTVEGRNVPAHYPVKSREKITVDPPKAVFDQTRAEEIPLDILYEDEDLLAVNKPAGIVVHPAHGNLEHTLVNALLFHTRQLSDINGPIRPGIVHRLDKDTSGVLVVAKNDKTHASLGNQFKRHTIDRVYFAIVKGVVQHDEGICEEPVGRAFVNRQKIVIKPSGGKDAKTLFRVEKRFPKATLLRIMPQTGRTHQIRVHMAHLNHPVLGDTLYGVPSPWIKRQALHAAKLAVTHPKTHQRLVFESPLPADMTALMAQLESGK